MMLNKERAFMINYELYLRVLIDAAAEAPGHDGARVLHNTIANSHERTDAMVEHARQNVLQHALYRKMLSYIL